MTTPSNSSLAISTTDDVVQEEVADVCDTPWEYTNLVLRIILCLILIPLGVYVLVLYQRLHKKKLREKKRSPKFLHCTTITYYVIHLVYFVSLLLSAILGCAGIRPLYLAFANLITLSYVVHWVLLIMIYLARLHFVFQGTTLAINRRYICNFVCVCASFLVFAIIIVISRALSESENWVFLVLGWASSFLAAGMVSLVLSLMFIRKLFLLNLEKHVLDGNTENVAERESRLVQLMTRYTVMAIVSTLSTLLFILWMCAIITTEELQWVRDVANNLNVMDMTIDFVVMSFAFSFADTMYHRCCGTCHSGMERCCGSVTDKRREVQLAKLASIEQDNDSAGVQSSATNLTAMKPDSGATSTMTPSSAANTEEPTMNSTANSSDGAGAVTATQSAVHSEEDGSVV